MSTDEIYEVVGWTLSIVAVVGFIAGCIIWWVHDALHPEQAETVPLGDLMDDRPAADMWDSFEEADVHGIEVDDTAAEADMVPANGPFVVAQGRALVEDIDAWMTGLDVEAWLGERGWL